ncbi:MAG: hypothetical protein HRU41_41955 [Saprospiraceae bacterium]|nr:hypothetical protein [Saprospiraceae bacterium]
MTDYSKVCKELRGKYGFTAKKMSQIYGFGINQWRLYENGKAPSISNGRLILLSTDTEVFKAIYFLYENPSKSEALAEKGMLEAFQLDLTRPKFIVNQLVKWPKRGTVDQFLHGRIMVIVPVGVLPTNEWLSDKVKLDRLRKWDLETTIPRNHESYIVINKIGVTEKSKLRLMWPVVENLKSVLATDDYSLPCKIQV